MSKPRKPRTVKAAASLLERHAVLVGQIERIEATRSAAIAAANTSADAELLPLVEEREDLASVLEDWWTRSGHELTEGKRKSVELGGCMIGTRQGKESLGIAGDEDKIIAALKRRKWAEPLLRIKPTINKPAVLASIEGVYARDLKALGFSKVEGKVTFYIDRTEQGGTVGAAS